MSCNDQLVGYDEGGTLKLDCQSNYCKHSTNCSILIKTFHPATLDISERIAQNELDYQWIGWCKYTVKAVPEFSTFYSWKKDTTNAVIYPIYKSSDEPASNGIGIDTASVTATGDTDWSYLDAMYGMDYLTGNQLLDADAQLAADCNHDGEITYFRRHSDHE